jgi:hypothetical protein
MVLHIERLVPLELRSTNLAYYVDEHCYFAFRKQDNNLSQDYDAISLK